VKIAQVSASVMKPEKARSRWIVYSVGSRGKTYRAYGQPSFTDEFDAREWAEKYSDLYDEVTTLVFNHSLPLKGGKAAR
jgi:hypothetical protein